MTPPPDGPAVVVTKRARLAQGSLVVTHYAGGDVMLAAFPEHVAGEIGASWNLHLSRAQADALVEALLAPEATP